MRALARWAWLLLVPAVPLVQTRVEPRLGESRAQHESLYVWSGARLKRMAPGFENVLADIYWLRTVQYFGEERLFAKEMRFELLRPLIAITTTLDPRLQIAYRYGAIFLAEPRPVGADQPDQAIAVLQDGIHQNPSSWQLYWTLGYFYYQFKDQPRRASEVFLEGSRLPGAPSWLKNMAADVAARGGDRETAKLLWARIAEQSEEGFMRDNARHHLLSLQAQDGLDLLRPAVLTFRERNGRWPATLAELPGTGGQVPRDPAGTPFRYDARTGRVDVDPRSEAWRPGS